MSTRTAAASRPRLTANRNYLAWLAADTSSQFGTAIRAFAMTLITYRVTGSYVQAGLVSTVSTITMIAVMLPGGVLVDAWDRRTCLNVSAGIRLSIYSAAAGAWWAGVLSLPVLMGVGIASGLNSGLFSGASNAAMKSIMTSQELPHAAAANQGRDGAINLSASPVSGLLMSISYGLPFLAAAAGALLQLVCTRLIRADLRPRHGDPADPVGRADPAPARRFRQPRWIAGFTLLARNPLLARLVPASIFVNAGIEALFTGITLTLQGRGVLTWRIGLVDSAAAAGMLVGAIFAQRLIATIPTGKLTVGLFIGATAVLMPVAISQRLPVVLSCFGLLGLALPGLNGAMGGYMQAVIPEDLQGRGFAALGLVQQTVPALMPALVGVGLARWGAAPTMGATVVLFPLAAAFIVGNRQLRALPTPDQWDLASVAP